MMPRDTERDEHTPLFTESRAYPRVKVHSLAYIELGEGNAGLILNISETGMAIQAVQMLSSNRLTRMQFRLPKTEKLIQASGKVIWQIRSRKEAGIEFDGLSEQMRGAIRSWIAAEENRQGQSEQIHLRPLADLVKPTPQATAFQKYPSESGDKDEDMEVGVPLATSQPAAIESAASSPARTEDVTTSPPVKENAAAGSATAESRSPSQTKPENGNRIGDGFPAAAEPPAPLKFPPTQRRIPERWRPEPKTPEPQDAVRPPIPDPTPVQMFGTPAWNRRAVPSVISSEPTHDRRRWPYALAVALLTIIALIGMTTLDPGAINNTRIGAWVSAITGARKQAPHASATESTQANSVSASAESSLPSQTIPTAPNAQAAPNGQAAPPATENSAAKSQSAENGAAPAVQNDSANQQWTTANDADAAPAVTSPAQTNAVNQSSAPAAASRTASQSSYDSQTSRSAQPSPAPVANGTNPQGTATPYRSNQSAPRPTAVEQHASETSRVTPNQPARSSANKPSPTQQAETQAHASNNALLASRNASSAREPVTRPIQNRTAPGNVQDAYSRTAAPADNRTSYASRPVAQAAGPQNQAQVRQQPTDSSTLQTWRSQTASPEQSKPASNSTVAQNRTPVRHSNQFQDAYANSAPYVASRPSKKAQTAAATPQALIVEMPGYPSTAVPPSMPLAGVPSGSVAANSQFRAIWIPTNLEWARQYLPGNLGVGQLLSSYSPAYPIEAAREGIQGTVKLDVTVSTDGTVRSVRVLGGPPILAHAAVSAVRDWRYAESFLAGQPIETEQYVTVIFRLAQTE